MLVKTFFRFMKLLSVTLKCLWPNQKTFHLPRILLHLPRTYFRSSLREFFLDSAKLFLSVSIYCRLIKNKKLKPISFLSTFLEPQSFYLKDHFLKFALIWFYNQLLRKENDFHRQMFCSRSRPPLPQKSIYLTFGI